MPILLIAVVAMLVQQMMATVAKTGVPVLFKAIADDLGFEAEFVLLYTWAFATVGIAVMLGCGAFLIRFGALRMSQVGCAFMGVGLAVSAAADGDFLNIAAVLFVTAVLVSIGATIATPASSQILARYSPPRWAPLVFSIKQSGVPAGVVISSVLAPALALAFGWRFAVLALGGACLFIAFALEPCRKEFDAERRPDHRLAFAGLSQTFMYVLREPALRTLAGCGFAFIGLQAIFTNYTIVYLTEELHYDLAAAGVALGAATLVAIPGRIVWGWVGSTWLSPVTLLLVLALVMACGAVGMGMYDSSWSRAAVMVPLVLVSGTALSWHGLLLAEVARLAPEGEVGRMTGGVLAFGTAGQVVFPLFFYLGYLAAGYRGAYIAVAVPAAVAAIALLRAQVRGVSDR
ncbi:MAG: MFS family permease [Gammaproteobacteria bacterium]|jgi:MFS family permease